MTLGAPGESTYRPDVDGLRAVAVLSVLACHAFPDVLPGGFIGVDIFFVISGYLISRIILGDLQGDRFTFRTFYSRRVRRIFPALTLVLAASLIFGWLALLPFDFRELGAHVAAGAAFVSNILLWSEAGNYFDPDSKMKPLLHLWSLGVEEQYYLLWPVLLFMLRRHARFVPAMIVGVAMASFALNIFLVAEHPSVTFYLPPTRFWELMVGSLLAYIHLNRPAALTPLFFGPSGSSRAGSPFPADVASLAGAALIAVGLLAVDEQSVFPGWWALLPTLGAVLLIAAGPDGLINRQLLAHPSLVFVGLVSYPLYLWHWPVLSYARILNGGELPVAVRIAAVVVSLLLAWLTYQYVEKRVRHAHPTRGAIWPVGALATFVAALGAMGLLIVTGYSQARSASTPYLDDISVAVHDWEEIRDQTIHGDTRKTVLFLGDSHMQQYLPRLEQLARDRTAPVRTVVFRTRGGCAPVPDIERRGRSCDSFVGSALALAQQPDVDIVVLAASWTGFVQRGDYYRTGEYSGPPLDLAAMESEWVMQGFEAALARLTRDGKRVVIVLSSPRGPQFDPRKMARRSGLGFEVELSDPVPRSTVVEQNAFIDGRLRQIADRVGAELVNPLDALCDAGSCRTTDSDGNPLFMDPSHLRASTVRKGFAALDKYVYIGPVTDGPLTMLR